MEPLLEAQSLVKTFGSIIAVDGVTFAVGKGEVLGFLGPNGAGKSTTMKMLTGFLHPTAGLARIAGLDVAHDGIAAKRLLGYLPEGAPAYGDMTPRGFLAFVARARGLNAIDARAAINHAAVAAHITGVLDQPVETLSKGFKRRVGLAQAILHDPDVLVLDEPTDGLDPNQKHEMRRLIQAMAPDKAIIISTHILEEVEAVCSRAMIIDRGRVVADDTPAGLRMRSRFHGAVTLTLAAGVGADVATLLKALPGVVDVTVARGSDGRMMVTVFPEPGVTVLDRVAEAARAAGWPVSEITVDPGRLDDVFRMLTTGEAA